MLWLRRLMFMLVVSSFPTTGFDADVARIQAALPTEGCAVLTAPIDHAGVLEQVQHAYQWNARLHGTPYGAIDHQYFKPESVLTTVDDWMPMISCVAHEFDIPPELLAGIMALELDLDYHFTDAVLDNLVISPVGSFFSHIEAGAAYAGVHFGHLKAAVALLGEQYSASPFYRGYYHLITTRSDDELTYLATRYRLLDITDAAIMARYYATLRLGNRPLSQLTTTNMAFVWSAYRGGVIGTTVDPRPDSRWLLENYQRADNPQILGDTIIAMPYFAYYRTFYGLVRWS